jgi:hypothetical protein
MNAGSSDNYAGLIVVISLFNEELPLTAYRRYIRPSRLWDDFPSGKYRSFREVLLSHHPAAVDEALVEPTNTRTLRRSAVRRGAASQSQEAPSCLELPRG